MRTWMSKPEATRRAAGRPTGYRNDPAGDPYKSKSAATLLIVAAWVLLTASSTQGSGPLRPQSWGYQTGPLRPQCWGYQTGRARMVAETSGGSSTEMAPAFTLVDTHGHTITSDSLRGRIVVLNFWAFWCDTWKAELPHLKELVKHEDDSGFTTVAVSVDGTRYPEFARLTGDDLPFPVCLDLGSKVTQAYHVAHVPTVVIIDPQGRIAYSHYGYPGNDVVLSQVRRIAKLGPVAKSRGSGPLTQKLAGRRLASLRPPSPQSWGNRTEASQALTHGGRGRLSSDDRRSS